MSGIAGLLEDLLVGKAEAKDRIERLERVIRAAILELNSRVHPSNEIDPVVSMLKSELEEEK